MDLLLTLREYLQFFGAPLLVLAVTALVFRRGTRERYREAGALPFADDELHERSLRREHRRF